MADRARPRGVAPVEAPTTNANGETRGHERERLCRHCGHRPAAACEECRRALALFADYQPDEWDHPDGAAAGFYAIARHPEAGRDCRLCGAGRAELCTYCLLELAGDHRRAVRGEH